MASDVIFALRTVTRCFMGRQVMIEGERVLLPIAEAIPPESLSLASGENFGEIPGRALNGEKRIEFTYTDERKPELTMSYGAAPPDFDTLMVGKIMTSRNNFPGFTYFELIAESPSYPARASGNLGYAVAAQDSTSTADIYYIDPTTKLAKSVAVVDSSDTPSGDEIKIDAHMALTLSPELAASGVTLRGWVPCVYPRATIMTAESIGLITVRALGVTYGNEVVGFSARNCSRFQGGELGAEKKAVKLRINPDASDGTDLGFQVLYTDEAVA